MSEYGELYRKLALVNSNKVIALLATVEVATLADNDIILAAINALEAADRMADVVARMHNGAGVWGSSHEALTTYRNLTQETPHAG